MEDGDLLNASGGDPARARVLRQLLEHLGRDSPDDRLREMASAVLNGEVSLAAAVGSSAYGEAIAARTAGFTTWYDSLSETERADQAGAAAAKIAEVRDEMDRQAAADDAP